MSLLPFDGRGKLTNAGKIYLSAFAAFCGAVAVLGFVNRPTTPTPPTATPPVATQPETPVPSASPFSETHTWGRRWGDRISGMVDNILDGFLDGGSFVYIRGYGNRVYIRSGGEGVSISSTATDWIWNDVNNAASWNVVLQGIKDAGNNRSHTINITGNFYVPGSHYWSFGNVTGITVTLSGNHTITLSSAGHFLAVGRNQALTVRDTTLHGFLSNDRAVVEIWGGSFTMQGRATISGNTNRQINGTGGGVMLNGGTFRMEGNSSISGNTAANGGGVGIFGGTFTKTGGTIHGSNALANLRNTASTSGHAVFQNDPHRTRNTTAGTTMNTATAGFWGN